MNIIEKLFGAYKPQKSEKEYVISRVETYHENADLQTLSIEITTHPEVIAVLRKELVGKAYTTLAQSTEWELK